MAKEEPYNKLITLFLAIVICLAAITILYVNLPDSQDEDSTDDGTEDTNDDNNDNDEEESVILTISYGTESYEYTLSELEDLEAYDGNGKYLKVGALDQGSVIVKGPYNYTGIKMTTLLDKFDSLPEEYNVTVTATDGWENEYTKDQVNGNVDFYNETTGEIVEEGTTTMLLAYKEDGEYLEVGEGLPGPTRFVFVSEDSTTGSNIWAKMVESIEIVEL